MHQIGGSDEHPKIGVKSTDGEVRCTMKNGVRYVLRFGDVESLGTDADDKASDDKQDVDSSGTKLNRYMFVVAEFDASMIPAPKEEPLPTAKAEPAKTEPAKTEPAKTEPAKTEPKKAEPAENKATAPESIDDAATAEDASGEDAKNEVPCGGTPDDEGDENKSAEDDAQRKADAAVKNLAAEIQRITTANKNKKAAYEKKLKAGRDRVKELNVRFAEWYFVISDDIYKKIHLNRDAIVKKKEKEDDDTAQGTTVPGDVVIQPPKGVDFDKPLTTTSPAETGQSKDEKPDDAKSDGQPSEGKSSDGKSSEGADLDEASTTASPAGVEQPKDEQPGDEPTEDKPNSGDE